MEFTLKHYAVLTGLTATGFWVTSIVNSVRAGFLDFGCISFILVMIANTLLYRHVIKSETQVPKKKYPTLWLSLGSLLYSISPLEFYFLCTNRSVPERWARRFKKSVQKWSRFRDERCRWRINTSDVTGWRGCIVLYHHIEGVWMYGMVSSILYHIKKPATWFNIFSNRCIMWSCTFGIMSGSVIAEAPEWHMIGRNKSSINPTSMVVVDPVWLVNQFL